MIGIIIPCTDGARTIAASVPCQARPRSQTPKVGHAVNLTQSMNGVGFMQQSAVELLWKGGSSNHDLRTPGTACRSAVVIGQDRKACRHGQQPAIRQSGPVARVLLMLAAGKSSAGYLPIQ